MSVVDEILSLSSIAKNQISRITALGKLTVSNDETTMVTRLRDMGFEEGRMVEVIHTGPFGADPMAVRVEGSTIALRRAEASFIQVALEKAQHAD